MGRQTKGDSGGASVSASELAQMGRCERLVVFEHVHGGRRTESQQRDRKRGLLAHEQFKHEGLDAMSAVALRRGRCFIATCVFGDSWQTRSLRRFRDVMFASEDGGLRYIRRNTMLGRPGELTELDGLHETGQLGGDAGVARARRDERDGQRERIAGDPEQHGPQPRQ